jgi:protein required for attachment to host cells
MTAWILVTDVSRARIFSAELREDAWSHVKEFNHPEGRESSSEISPSGPPGRMQQSTASGGRRTALQPHTTPKEAESERFAQLLGNYLEEALAKREFDYLVLVAPPHFLGLIHGSLGRQTLKHLRATIDKDLGMFGEHELRSRLVDVVFPTTPAKK